MVASEAYDTRTLGQVLWFRTCHLAEPAAKRYEFVSVYK